MTERQLLYRGLSFLSVICYALLEVFIKMSGKDMPGLKLIQDLISFSTVLFATLWLRNIPIIIALSLYLIEFNLFIFKNSLLSNITLQEFAKGYSSFGFIVYIIVIILYFLSISENTKKKAITKEVHFKDSTIVLRALGVICIVQTIGRVYCA